MELNYDMNITTINICNWNTNCTYTCEDNKENKEERDYNNYNNYNRVICVTHHFNEEKKYTITRVRKQNGYYDTVIKKRNVDIDYIIKWNSKFNSKRVNDIEFKYALLVDNNDGITFKYVEFADYQFLDKDYVYQPKKRYSQRKKDNTAVLTVNTPRVDWTLTANVSVVKSDTFDENYAGCYIRAYRVKQLIFFQSQITGVNLDYAVKHSIPVTYTNGVNTDLNYVNIYCDLGLADNLKSVLESVIHNDKKSRQLAISKMNRQILYLLGVNIMNNNITRDSITANIVMQCYLMIIKGVFRNSKLPYFNISFQHLSDAAERFVKKLNDGSNKALMCDNGILNLAYKYYGHSYTGIRYPTEWNIEQKKEYKKKQGIVRKQRLVTKPVAKHKPHKQRTDSLDSRIRECFDKKMKQKDVVTLLSVSKGVVSKWYTKFKSEMK